MNTQFEIANIKYERVVPRDLFNEAKLLKCIGLVALMILDNKTPVAMAIEEHGNAFKIGLLDDGYLTITNYEISIKGNPYTFKCQYNSKSNYNLFVEYNYCEYLVFDEKGNFYTEFIDFVNSL